MLLPAESDLALKEWAVAVRVMAQGGQILILRKGGIHRDDREFRVVHPEFLLYPTYEHQKPELVKQAYRADLEETVRENDIPGLATLGFWCRVTERFEVRDEQALERISDQHIWQHDYALKRLHWRPKQPLTVALARLYRLQQPQALPVLDEYAGCKSWVELGQDVPLGSMVPVLSEIEYEERADAVRRALGATPSAV